MNQLLMAEKLIAIGDLGFMPEPLKDEILHSIIARLQTRALIESPGQLSLDLFGERNIPATVDLPSHLHFFSERVKGVFPFSEDQIIEQFTLWPYYSRFIVDKKKRKALELIRGNNGSGLHNLIGINASAMVKNRGLKYCPACANEDKTTEGIYYWHRVHQIPDLHLCPDHKCQLITHVASANDLRRSVYTDANEVIMELPPIQAESNERLIDLSMFMASILRGESSFDINTVNYKAIVENSIFNKGSKKIENAFIESFINFYGNDLIEMILPGISTHWLKGIINRPFHFFHPVRHLMVTTFLSQVPKKEKEPALFGDGPWPCLNKAANHFAENVVTDIAVHFDRKTKRQIARLSCSCGMIYTKSYLNEKGAERKEFTRIIAWGDVWLNALKRELSEKQSYRTIARKLGTDAKTISKYTSEGKKEDTQQNISVDKITQVNRRKWQRLLAKFTMNRILSARKKNTSLYIWLYRHDNAWFAETNKANHVDQPTSELRLDWTNLDKKVVDLIIETVDRLKKEKYRCRITKSLISKIIRGQHYLLGKNAGKFPKSIASLNSQIESKDQFHQRRILETIVELRTINQLKGWKVMRRAGLGRKISESALNLLNETILYGS